MVKPNPAHLQRRRGYLRRLWGVGRDERGSATAELAVATPLLLLMLMAIVQFVLWSHAVHVAQAAATHGLGAARAQYGSDTDGTQVATRMLAQLADGPLVDPAVTATRDATSVTVTVTGTATPLVPLVVLPVRAQATGPVERFAPREREPA